MPLRLEVVSAHRESMGGAYVQEFAACGGTIGRSLECDWPLPDAKRYISSRHAMIDYQGGAYYLVDLSRNGVYVNGSDAPVGNGNPQRLFDGDTIRLGEFEIAVHLSADAQSEDGMQDSIVRAQLVQVDESAEVTMLPPEQISGAYSLDELLTPGDNTGELSAIREIPPEASALLRQAGHKHGVAAATQAFLKAAGLEPKDFKDMNPVELLQNAARIFAEFTEGTHALLASKDAINSRLKIKSGGEHQRANPLRSSEGINNAVRLLLGTRSESNLAGTKAVQAAFDELLRHQRAVVAAMRNAAKDTAKETKPEEFDQEFARAYELETTE